MPPILSFLFAFSIFIARVIGNDICRASCEVNEESGQEICKFTAGVNMHAGELGYFQFQECGDVNNPTLGLEIGKTYKFIQQAPSNHYHPLGFAYYPDGAHADADELEPSIDPPGSSTSCSSDLSCPAPMYFLNDVYLGSYSNNENIVSIEEQRSSSYSSSNDFGLDGYEPKFIHPLTEWLSYGNFSVYLKFDNNTDYSKDIFYFCHIHQFMTGRIKLLKNDVPIQEDTNLPELGYEYDVMEDHDAVCGTYGLNQFQLPHAECPQKFVCDASSENESLLQFSKCIDSMNCAMMAGMTTSVKETADATALFIHQMIPHHQNAVNMAKALLKFGNLQCDDLTGDDADCAMKVILFEIISNQNQQIQGMRDILEAKNFPQENDCTVIVSSSQESNAASSAASSVAPAIHVGFLSALLVLVLRMI